MGARTKGLRGACAPGRAGPGAAQKSCREGSRVRRGNGHRCCRLAPGHALRVYSTQAALGHLLHSRPQVLIWLSYLMEERLREVKEPALGLTAGQRRQDLNQGLSACLLPWSPHPMVGKGMGWSEGLPLHRSAPVPGPCFSESHADIP